MKVKRTQHSTFNIQHSSLKDVETGRDHFEEGPSRRFDLEDRLLEFSVAVIQLSENLPETRSGNHVAGQILRSGTASYPNHGEAEAAESRDDFIHKPKICLKELRETRRWARLVKRMGWASGVAALPTVLSESDELIRIFYSSIQTAQRNSSLEKRGGPGHLGYPRASGN